MWQSVHTVAADVANITPEPLLQLSRCLGFSGTLQKPLSPLPVQWQNEDSAGHGCHSPNVSLFE